MRACALNTFVALLLAGLVAVSPPSARAGSSGASNAGGADPGIDDPSTLAGLLIWLDASQDDATYNEGDAVPTANNFGSGTDFTQATAGLRPTFRTSVVGTYDAYRFDGGDCLTNSSVALSTFSAFFVFYGTGASALLYEHSADAGASDGSYLVNGVNYTSLIRRDNGLGRDIGHAGNTWASWGINKAWHVVNQSWDGSAEIVGDTGSSVRGNRLNLDGTTPPTVVTTGTNACSTNCTATITTELNIGCRNEASSFFTGDIAEVLFYTPRLSEADEVLVLDYLAGKYGLR